MNKPGYKNVSLVDLNRMHAPIQDELDAAISTVVERGDFVGGQAVGAFESAFADYCGSAYCIGVANGTDAIELALRANGVGPGDEVITVPNTFIATVEAISAVGADPVFVDCDAETYLVDIAALEAAITPRTRAVVPVHLYGRMVDMTRVMDLAKKNDLVVIEDAAQAHGARHAGRRAGQIGHAGCFSFYPGKNLGAFGDAGCVVTDNASVAEQVRLLANHGRASRNDHVLIGRNSRMDTIQAAVLGVKLAALDDWNARRMDAAQRYLERLSELPLITPDCPVDGSHVYHLFVVRVRERDAVLAALRERGVGAGIHYQTAIPDTAAYASMGLHDAFPNARLFASQVLSLPMHPYLDEADIDYVCRILTELLEDIEAPAA